MIDYEKLHRKIIKDYLNCKKELYGITEYTDDYTKGVAYGRYQELKKLFIELGGVE